MPDGETHISARQWRRSRAQRAKLAGAPVKVDRSHRA